MKKVISAVLTAAMVVGMGVSVLAATPSKTVADEVKASGSATVTGVLGIVSDVKVTAKEDTAQVEEVLQDITSDADLQKAAGASKEKKTTVDVTVTQAFEMQTSNLLDAANVKLTIESKVIEAAYEDNEQVTVLVAVPKTKADGTVTYTYYTVPGKVVDGKIVVNLKGRQVKLYGSNFVLVAVKTIEGLRTRNVLRCSLMKKGTPHFWRIGFREIEERAQRPGRMGGSIIRL